jgi:hypothetical protein
VLVSVHGVARTPAAPAGAPSGRRAVGQACWRRGAQTGCPAARAQGGADGRAQGGRGRAGGREQAGTDGRAQTVRRRRAGGDNLAILNGAGRAVGNGAARKGKINWRLKYWDTCKFGPI